MNSTTSRGHSGGAGSRGRSESAKLDRIHGEGELGGTSGDEGELGGTSGDEGELGGTGWRANSGADSASSRDGAGSGADSASSRDGAGSGADSASSRDGAGSGADSASSWDGAGSGADSPSSWDGADNAADLGMPAACTDTSGGSAGVVAILVNGMVSPSSSATPTVNEEPAYNKA